MPKQIIGRNAAISKTKSLLKRSLLMGVGVSTLALSQASLAQDNSDEIVVTGTRQVIQDAIKLKRQATTVVDGLSADEIGEIPALSIAEALEQITSVGSQREGCLLYTSPSPRDRTRSRMPSSA